MQQAIEQDPAAVLALGLELTFITDDPAEKAQILNVLADLPQPGALIQWGPGFYLTVLGTLGCLVDGLGLLGFSILAPRLLPRAG